jgi:hypothetical protein
MLDGKKILQAVKVHSELSMRIVEENTNAQANTAQKLTLLIKAQEGTNALLQRLIEVDQNFVGVIENFFALRKKLDIDESRRREKRELDLKGTPDDDRY